MSIRKRWSISCGKVDLFMLCHEKNPLGLLSVAFWKIIIWTLTLIGMRGDTFISLSFLDQILSAEFLSKISKLICLVFIAHSSSCQWGLNHPTPSRFSYLPPPLGHEFMWQSCEMQLRHLTPNYNPFTMWPTILFGSSISILYLVKPTNFIQHIFCTFIGGFHLYFFPFKFPFIYISI